MTVFEHILSQKKSLSIIIKRSTRVSKWNFNVDERIHVNIMRPEPQKWKYRLYWKDYLCIYLK